MIRDDSNPAFPVPGLQSDPDFNGISVRAYFAAKVMEAAVIHHGTGIADARDIAFVSVHYADALIAELAK